jgi:cysteine desulfurase family protein (TIGR01976 family)
MSATDVQSPALAVGLNRDRFPGLADGWVRADAPSGTQPLDACIEAMRDYMGDGRAANLHGAFHASRETDRLLAAARESVARLLGGEPAGVVFGPSMTALTFRFATAVAGTLAPGDRVVSTVLEHDANLRPWQLAARAAGADFTLIKLDEPSLGLDPASIATAIDRRTRWVAVSAASNALGLVPDLEPVIAAARDVGARVYVDAVHAVPHLPLDMRELGIDVIACSAYKWFGPHVGILCADPQLLRELSPQKLVPAPDVAPESWEQGALPFEAMPGLCACVDYLLTTGMATIAEHDRALAAELRSGLNAIGGVNIFGNGRRHTPTAFFTVAGQTPEDVSRALAERHVAATSGNLYALELSKALGLGADGAARLGFVHYSGLDNVRRAVAAVREIARS